MTAFVVDTNVVIAANGRQTHADPQCRLACIDKLTEIVERELVVIDDLDGKSSIIEEYSRHANWAGSPGVGDMFFKHVFNNQHVKKHVLRFFVTPLKDENRGFEELPPNSFDQSDRKFLAVAVVAKATVLNATDSDWEEHGDLMKKLKAKVIQLCPQHATKQPSSNS